MNGTMTIDPPVRTVTLLKLAKLERLAGPVFEVDDPLKLVKKALREGGYGGDLRPAFLTYIAATTRLLTMRPGSMPCHLLLVGPPSAGKSYTMDSVRRLLPRIACVVISAGSPRALIYGNDDLRHRALFFGEADSIPSGEDNPAASAVRNLLQDHRLRYDVVVRDPSSGGYAVDHIDRPGPTVLITTSTRSLGPQMDSRLFSVDVPDDQEQVRATLRAQARLEREGASRQPTALVAYQALLQLAAPWDVAVPFGDALAEAIGQSPAGSRVTRDYARIMTLIKAVAILRHRHRCTNSRGQIEAALADYKLVYWLLRDVYASSATGAGRRVREVVEAVAALQQHRIPGKAIIETAIATELGTNRMMVSRYVKKALAGGWLVNEDSRPRRYDLRIGEPLPGDGGLPRPSALSV